MACEASSPMYQVMSFSGQLDGHSPESSEYCRMLDTSNFKVNNHVLFDLSKAEYANSTFIGLFMRCHNIAQEAGYKILLYAPSPALRNVLIRTGVNSFIPVVNNEEEALEAIANGASVLDLRDSL